MSEFKLLKFESCLDEVLCSIEDAVCQAEMIAEDCDGQWESLNVTLERLKSLKTAWENVLDRNVQIAIDEERVEFERQCDLFDAQRGVNYGTNA